MIKLLQHTRRPDITFYRNGTIRITSRIAAILSLRPGDSINIASAGSEFLLYAIPSADAGPSARRIARCFPSKRGSTNLVVQCASLSRALLDSIGTPDAKKSFLVGDPVTCEGHLCLPIITRLNLTSNE